MRTYSSATCLRALVVALLTAATATGCGSQEDVARTAMSEPTPPPAAAASPPPADQEAATLEAVTAAKSVSDVDGVSTALQRMPERLGDVERQLGASSVRYGDAGLEALRLEDGLPPADSLQERVDVALTGQGVTVARRCAADGVVCATGNLPSGGHVAVWVPEGSELVFAALAPSAEELLALTESFANAAE